MEFRKESGFRDLVYTLKLNLIGVAVDDDLRCCHQLGGLNHVVLMMVAAQVCVRSTSVK